MVCPRCNNDNVTITTEKVSAKSEHKDTTILWLIGRVIMIFCTCGLWLLVPRHRGKSDTAYTYQTVGICQACGNKWIINSK